jgi:hypothetical protein
MVIDMDLLYSQINNIPVGEQLEAVYIINDLVLYASTSQICAEDKVYKLYNVVGHQISDFKCQHSKLNYFDKYIANKLNNIITQSGHEENGIKVVCFTIGNTKQIKHSTQERVEISRYISNRKNRLF